MPSQRQSRHHIEVSKRLPENFYVIGDSTMVEVHMKLKKREEVHFLKKGVQKGFLELIQGIWVTDGHFNMCEEQGVLVLRHIDIWEYFLLLFIFIFTHYIFYHILCMFMLETTAWFVCIVNHVYNVVYFIFIVSYLLFGSM